MEKSYKGRCNFVRHKLWYFLELLETGGLQPPWTDKAEGGRIGFDKGKKLI
jgi:hypothetical protein